MTHLFKLLTIFFLLISCENSKKSQQQTIQPYKIEDYIKTLQQSQPDWKNNEVTIKKLSDSFTKGLPSQLNSGLLDDAPLTLKSVTEYKKGAFSALFSNRHSKSEEPYRFYDRINFNVLALIPDSLAIKLKENSDYTVRGHFINFLGDEYSLLTNHMAYTNEVGIKKDIVDSYQYNLGIMLFDKVTISPVTYDK